MLTADISILTATAVGALALGTCTIVYLTWRNAQATGSIAQLLHRTEKQPYHGEIDPRRFADRDRD